MRKVNFTETVLRDANQSLIATRLPYEKFEPILETMDKAGYYSAEVWGGATARPRAVCVMACRSWWRKSLYLVVGADLASSQRGRLALAQRGWVNDVNPEPSSGCSPLAGKREDDSIPLVSRGQAYRPFMTLNIGLYVLVQGAKSVALWC